MGESALKLFDAVRLCHQRLSSAAGSQRSGMTVGWSELFGSVTCFLSLRAGTDLTTLHYRPSRGGVLVSTRPQSV